MASLANNKTKLWNGVIILLLCLMELKLVAGSAIEPPPMIDKIPLIGSGSVKKELKVTAPLVKQPLAATSQQTIVISEKTLAENEAAKQALAEKQQQDAHIKSEDSKLPTDQELDSNEVHAEEVNFEHKMHMLGADDDEMPDSFKTTFYLFLGLSTAAVLFIVVKVYRLRLSRAERKYGVQGDRTTQELTPLPISIEDNNSDDEDQTVFEINRQQIRIL